MNTYETLAHITGSSPETLEQFERIAGEASGKKDVLSHVLAENNKAVERTLSALGVSSDASAEAVREALRGAVGEHEEKLRSVLRSAGEGSEFDTAASLARELAQTTAGFFLKKEYIESIFRAHPPENLIRYRDHGSVDELIENEPDLTAAFSALRFVEDDEWMHKTFEVAYSDFTAEDFEERDVEVMVLDDSWKEIAEKFVAKKHHNVSHLKEFGVIFLNPIHMNTPGALLRDFALLLHYFHEITFYSKLFRRYAGEGNFAEQVKSLLRGDVKDLESVSGDDRWLIVQRYLFKDDPNDPRLSRPRVNPESLHWARGERDVTRIGSVVDDDIDLSLWKDLDWVAGLFPGEGGAMESVSFDLEDTAMSLVASIEGTNDVFTYHQREAIWNRIFSEYFGGEEALEQRIIENFDQGFVTL